MNRFVFQALFATVAVVGITADPCYAFYYNKIAFQYTSTTDGGIRFGGGSSFPALPADFFGPGSLPFEGFIPLTGGPGGASIVVDGNGASEKGGTEDINIGVGELQECTVFSQNPITVNFLDGSTQQWNLAINLDPLQQSDAVVEFTDNPPGAPAGGAILPIDSFFDIFADVTFSHAPAGAPPQFRSFAIVDRASLTTTGATWAPSHSSIAGGANRVFVPGANPADPSAPLQLLLFEGGGLNLPLVVTSVVPEPSALLLFATGTAALAASRFRRRR